MKTADIPFLFQLFLVLLHFTIHLFKASLVVVWLELLVPESLAIDNEVQIQSKSFPIKKGRRFSSTNQEDYETYT